MRWRRTRMAATVLATAIMAGCSGQSPRRGFEYMPDMVRTPAYKSFSPNPVTRDGLTLQRPVAGTVARGAEPFHYGPSQEEAERAGRALHNPFSPTPEVLAEGKARYEQFCGVCHGVRGQGDGPLVPKIPNPPSYTSDRVLAMQPGQIFHVITMGSGKMPSYASQTSVAERWQIVTYIAQLQQAKSSND